MVLWIGVIVIFFFLVLPFIQMHWPLPEPRAEREFCFTNIEAGGGWNAFSKECDTLIEHTRISGKQHWSSNDLSLSQCKIISALNPRSVYVNVEGGKIIYVDLFFSKEKPNKGGLLKQFYGLIYQQFPNSDQCVVRGLYQQPDLFHFNRITNSLFEVFYR